MYRRITDHFRGSTSEFFLLLAPLAYLAWEAVLYAARGPNWIMVPQDLSYNYLLNALNVLNGDPIGSLIHPALTTIGYVAAVTWIVHLLFGSGPLAAAVIADPEFYFSFAAHGTTLLTALSLFMMGRWAYQGLRSPWLVLLLQSFVFFPPPVEMVLNSYASPESMLVILAMLQVGLTLRTLDGRLEDTAARQTYVIAMAVISSTAVATKFIALPLLIVPLLVIPTWRSKVSYCLSLGIGIGIVLSPIALVRAHRAQFIADMAALVGSAVSESKSRGVGVSEAITSYVAQIYPILNGFPIFIYALILGLVLLVAVVLYRPMMRTAIQHCSRALRLLVIAQVVSAIAFIFVLGRPKSHYLVPFLLLQGMGFAAFFVIAGRHLTLIHSFDPGRSKTAVALGYAMVFGTVVGHNIFFQDGVPMLVLTQHAAFQMRSYSFNAPGDNAIVTAIQASNIPTALYHADQTSHQLHKARLGAVVAKNHYNYAFDGSNANSFRYGAVSFSDLKEMYDRVFFWTKRNHFGRNEWRQPIEAVWRDIRVAKFERLSELEALAIQERFDARLIPEQNAIRGWTMTVCKTDAVCLGFAVNPVDRKVVSHLRFLADPDQFATMPARWRLEASSNGRDWRMIENI